MKEDEAKTKWCPFVRAVQGQLDEASGASAHEGLQPSYNRVVDGLKHGYPTPGCIGSACMAWRWNNGAPSARSRRAIGSRAWAGMSPEQRRAEPVIRPLDISETWTLEPGDADDHAAPPKWVEPANETEARRVGRCGLAGQP